MRIIRCSDCGKPTGTKYNYCAECQAKNHSKWLAELKKWAVHQLGDKCSRCNQSFPLCCYDLHHLKDSASWHVRKRNASSSLRTSELIKWKREGKISEEIILLCANCHRIVHND